MSTTLTAATPSLATRSAAAVRPRAPATDGARGLSALLLAAVVATLVVIADQVINTWADGHLMLAWVLLWAVVFASLALFADTARRLARRTVVALDSWSRSMAEARAEMRLWEMARQDPRLMRELTAARDRADELAQPEAGDFSQALEPLGLHEPAAPVLSYWERLAEARARKPFQHYI